MLHPSRAHSPAAGALGAVGPDTGIDAEPAARRLFEQNSPAFHSMGASGNQLERKRELQMPSQLTDFAKCSGEGLEHRENHDRITYKCDVSTKSSTYI